MHKKRILLIQGHPDPHAAHFCHALQQAYAEGCAEADHELRHVPVASLDFPLLRSQQEWENEACLPPALAPVQQDILWAEHVVLVFPLWLGDMPALLKGFLEQVARPGFAVPADRRNPLTTKLLAGRSARVVVTMGMPARVYRWFFGAHSVKALERNILAFVGFAPVRETLIGSVDAMDSADRAEWVAKLRALGRAGG
ncbi:NAD(P)H-dependent oxidoreductase [Caldimonas brevitalea]|uniref:Dehydrogenase n=1 Tax=Caldimonas brevitalea TaxID=413882 RepID=A0A0G3BS05_9BURK|nr:NAD(P)H-dependent oxidoreductase [Caldimonas brevitalea]AKJ29280.1 dehydrogenase [Caldimonas brevitalea]